MNVASTSTASSTIPIAVIAVGTAGDHEWWAEQAAQNGTDWASVLDGARDLLAVAVGEVSSMDDTFERACREADREAALRPVDAKPRYVRRAPEATVDALVFSLRRGVSELTKPDTLRRLSALDKEQLKNVCRRVQAFKPEIAPVWTADAVDALISAWKNLND